MTDAPPTPKQRAFRLVADERRRQIHFEGRALTRVPRWRKGELALAAVSYALPSGLRSRLPHLWPWNFVNTPSGFKPTPHDRAREIATAAALLLAELERLLIERDGR